MPLKARFHRSQEYYLSRPALHVLLQHPVGHQVTAVAFYAQKGGLADLSLAAIEHQQ